MRLSRVLSIFGAVLVALAASGCGSAPTVVVPVAKAGHIQGTVHGGQQPVVGAAIQLYAVGTTANGNSAPLLTQTVVTDGGGGFDITNDYSCASATLVYLVATGGNPGVGSANGNIAVMAALGPCSALSGTTFISVNELTTVAAVSSLAPYMTSLTAVSSANGAALAAAFSTAGQMVDTAAGVSPGSGVPAGYTVPTPEIDTLGNILSTCINSAGGVAGDGSACGQLFSLTTPAGLAAPTDTVGALLDLAKYPTLNTPALYNLVPAAAPFQPSLSTAPPDFLIREALPASQIALSVTPATLTFSGVPVGTQSVAQNVTVTNTSQASVTLGAVTLAGTADYGLGASTCGVTLGAGQSCVVPVMAAPTATGTRTGYVSVVSSSPASPQYASLTTSAVSGGGTATLSVSASELDFTVNGGHQVLTLTNTGSGYLSLSGISNATSYFVETTTCGAGLAPAAACTVTVMDRAPSPDLQGFVAGGLYADRLTIVSSDSASPAYVDLTATNVAVFTASSLALASNGSSSFALDFGTAPSACPTVAVTGSGFSISSNGTSQYYVGQCFYTVSYSGSGGTGFLSYGTPVQTIPLVGYKPVTTGTVTLTGTNPITLSNYGSTALGIQSIVVPAGLTETNTCGNSVPAQSVCTISFGNANNSIEAGAIGGLLTVNDDAGSQSTGVSGTEVLQVLDFGPAQVGAQAAQNYTVLYGGRGQGSGGFYNGSADFIATSCSLMGVNYYTTCNGYATFKPQAAGLRLASLGAGSTSGSNSYVASGIGIGPGMYGLALPKVTPTTYQGGSVSNQVTEVLQGTTPTVSVTGPDAGAFSLQVGPNAGTYTFTPQHHGTSLATIVLTNPATGASSSFPAVGFAAYRAPVVNTYVYFPDTAINTDSTLVLPVTADQLHPITAAITSGAPAFRLGASTCAQGQTSCSVTVIFHPTTNGQMMGTLVVTDTVAGLSTTVTVDGAGGVGVLTVSPTSVDFGTHASGTTSIAKAVTVSNTGTNYFVVDSISISGANSSEFSYTGTYPTNFYPGNPCTLNVTFAPVTSGGKSASLDIVTTDGTTNVALTGVSQ